MTITYRRYKQSLELKTDYTKQYFFHYRNVNFRLIFRELIPYICGRKKMYAFYPLIIIAICISKHLVIFELCHYVTDTNARYTTQIAKKEVRYSKYLVTSISRTKTRKSTPEVLHTDIIQQKTKQPQTFLYIPKQIGRQTTGNGFFLILKMLSEQYWQVLLIIVLLYVLQKRST